jgi:hypothetical protein
MDDENRLLEVDTRVRAAVNPPDSVVDRVVTRALTDNDRPPQHRSRRRVVVVTVATAVLLLLSIWQVRERTEEQTAPNSMAITGDGSLLIVESHDRRRWIVGPVPQRPMSASYVVTALLGVPLAAQTPSPADPLQSRVTIDYRETPAAKVIGAVAAAAGLKVEIASGTLRPVTITLTNVKLGTALNAICENASCVWRLQGTLSVTPVPSNRSASLPVQVSFEVRDTPLSDFFRALAAAIDVPVTVDPGLSSEPRNWQFTNASTADILNMLCAMHNCHWDFDAVRGLRVTRKQ